MAPIKNLHQHRSALLRAGLRRLLKKKGRALTKRSTSFMDSRTSARRWRASPIAAPCRKIFIGDTHVPAAAATDLFRNWKYEGPNSTRFLAGREFPRLFVAA